jgi:hypothetical protein
MQPFLYFLLAVFKYLNFRREINYMSPYKSNISEMFKAVRERYGEASKDTWRTRYRFVPAMGWAPALIIGVSCLVQDPSMGETVYTAGAGIGELGTLGWAFLK